MLTMVVSTTAVKEAAHSNTSAKFLRVTGNLRLLRLPRENVRHLPDEDFGEFSLFVGVIRVELGDDQSSKARVRGEHTQGCHGIPKGQARIVLGHVGHGEVQEVDHVHVEVHHEPPRSRRQDRKSTRLNSSHANISYAVFCLKKKEAY